MACSTKALKIIALFFDFIYAFFGLAVIGSGVYILLEFEHLFEVGVAVTGTGVAIVLASIIGCVGAGRESSRITKSFIVSLVILAILELLLLGFLWKSRNDFIVSVDQSFSQLWNDQPVPIKPDNVSQIANVERWLNCCGKTGPKDYVHPAPSCYNQQTDKLNSEGCHQKFLDYFKEQRTAFMALLLVLILIEALCALVAYMLASSIINRWRRSKYYSK